MSYEFFTSKIARLFSGIVNEKIHDEYLEEEYQLFKPLLTIDRSILNENEEGNEIVKELPKSGLKPDNQNGIGDLPAFSSLILDIEFTEEELECRTRKKR